MINQFDETKAFFYENGFNLTSMPFRIGNMLAHYEIYKMITGIVGGVIEFGVFKGGSLIQWATFRELLENKLSRKIIGFDMFGPFPQSSTVKSDKNFIEEWNKETASEYLSKEELEKSLLYKGFDNVELIEGDIRDTLPIYLEENPAMRIALLHIDTDVYEPSKLALDLCWDRVVSGGIVVFDDYGKIEGETLAVDEFLEDKKYKLQKFSFSHQKPCFIIKE